MPASLTRTTLAVAVSSTSETQIQLISGTGVVVGYGLYVDREFMTVTDISKSPVIGVMRGQGGTRATPHLKGSTVFVAPKHYFTTYDRVAGSGGTYANENVSPYINILTGNIWSVLGGRWVANNTYGSYTNYGLSPAIWADCPLDKMLYDPGYGSFDGDDFVGESGSPFVTAHKYALTGANGTFAATASVPHGVALLTAPGTDNDESNIIVTNSGCQIKADAASTWWAEARVKINQIATAQGVFVGLSTEAGADFMTDNSMALKVVSSIGFQILAATDIAAIWQTVHQLAAGARAAVNATAGTASTSYVKLGMKSVAGTVTFYVNGVPDSSVVLSSAANFPLNAYLLQAFATKCGSAAANTLSVDWWKVAQTRIAN